jgi:hypothetical protein
MDTTNLEEKILDLALGRAIKVAYASLSDGQQSQMQKLFSQDSSDKDKEDFFKNNVANFEEILKTEAQKLQQEIFEEIKNRI